jgi:hypothetical protein
MNAYWTKLIDNSCVYTAATILHPSLNLSWFKDRWRRWPEWINKAQKQFDAFYERESKIHSTSSSAISDRDESLLESPPRKRRRYSMDEAEAAFEEILKVDRAYTRDPRAQRSKAQSELKDWYNFIDEHAQEGVINDPLNWWKQELEHNPRRFPTLKGIALDLFACPAMRTF